MQKFIIKYLVKIIYNVGRIGGKTLARRQLNKKN